MIYLSKLLIILFIGLMSWLPVNAQILVGVSTQWNDSFKEWNILGETEEDDGTLTMRWPLRNDWSSWDFRFEEIRGELYMRRANDPDYWEGSGDGQLVSCRAVWPGDKREWTVTMADIRIKIRTRFNNIADEWIAEDQRYGSFYMYTDWEGDPRDWIIEDKLSEEVPFLMKIMMMHIVLMQSVPRI